MRIVHVSDCFAPRVGGIESQVQDLGLTQARAGHAVHVLTATAQDPDATAPGASRYRTSETLDGILRVHRLATPVTFGVPMHPRGRSLITRALRLLEPDVVHIHVGVISPFAYHGAQAALTLGLPTAVSWHCVLAGAGQPLGWAARAGRWQEAPFAPAGVSALVAGQVATMLGRQDVQVVPNGLTLDPWRDSAANPEPNPVPEQLQVVVAQRLASRKRATALVDIVARAHAELGCTDADAPRIRLTIAGDGPDAAAVNSRIARAGLQEVVTMLGRVPRELLPMLYRAQDVFLSPTRLEAFGLAALEARTAGLAVVGMADSGITEFVRNGTEGLLAGNDSGLVDALVRLAQEPDLLAKITGHNRSRAPALGWSDVLHRVDRLYADARTRAP